MLRWVSLHIGWFFIRVVVTLACVWTTDNVIQREGYRVDIKDLFIVAVCLIVMMRFWMPRPFPKEKENKETTWSD
jgi:hypothetical protein